MNPQVDTYLKDGCGRCAYYRTPQCKVHSWSEELKELRRIVQGFDLKEDYKWSQPCYTHENKNVLIVTAFKDYAALAFFKGALMKDPQNVLIKPGKSSQAARQLRFTDVKRIKALEKVIRSYIKEAIEIERSGKKIEFIKNPEPIPEELQQTMDENPKFKEAFEALTPGRKRGYILHFSQPKQSKTRFSRIEKCTPLILKGEGLNDGYRSRK